MFNKEELLKNVTDNDERILYAKSLDKAVLTAKRHEPAFTPFFDPFKLDRFKKLLGYTDIKVIDYGGFDEAERRMIGFFPDYYDWDKAEFPITPVEISFNRFSKTLTHRDFLGSVLGLGITREKVGDIIVEDERAVVLAETSIAEYIAANLEYVGHTKINTKVLESYAPPLKEAVEKKITVASMRLDAVLSACFNMSRTKISDLIKGEKAYINWLGADSPSKQLCEGDIITLRGSGRAVLKEINGKTKKDRFLITVEIYK